MRAGNLSCRAETGILSREGNEKSFSCIPRQFYSPYELKAVRAGFLRLSRGNRNFVAGKLGDTFSYMSRKPGSLTESKSASVVIIKGSSKGSLNCIS